MIKKTEINFEFFFKIVGGKCCIKDEIRRKFWGCADAHGPFEPPSICAQFDAEQDKHYNAGLEPRTNLFDKMDYYEDTCYG